MLSIGNGCSLHFSIGQIHRLLYCKRILLLRSRSGHFFCCYYFPFSSLSNKETSLRLLQPPTGVLGGARLGARIRMHARAEKRITTNGFAEVSSGCAKSPLGAQWDCLVTSHCVSPLIRLLIPLPSMRVLFVGYELVVAVCIHGLPITRHTHEENMRSTFWSNDAHFFPRWLLR